MKRIMIVLMVLAVIGSMLVAGCSKSNQNSEVEEVKGKVVAVSSPFTSNGLRGIKVVALVWEQTIPPMFIPGGRFKTKTNIWLVVSPAPIQPKLNGKRINLRYITIDGNIPMVHVLSADVEK